MSYDIPKRVDPFAKPFPTGWVTICIALIIIMFVSLQCVRKVEVKSPNVTSALPPKNVSAQPAAPFEEQLFEEPQVDLLTVQDLTEPEFPEVEHELASVI